MCDRRHTTVVVTLLTLVTPDLVAAQAQHINRTGIQQVWTAAITATRNMGRE